MAHVWIGNAHTPFAFEFTLIASVEPEGPDSDLLAAGGQPDIMVLTLVRGSELPDAQPVARKNRHDQVDVHLV